MSDIPADLGHRIAAARAFVGISQETLADDLGMTPHALQRIEAGLDEPRGGWWELIETIAKATHLPTQAFTVDFELLRSGVSPETTLDRLEHMVEEMSKRLTDLVEQGERELRELVAVKAELRDTVRRLGEYLDTDKERPSP